ncbi:hypothetical protein [Cryptosporangium sp. NPDC051539]|uniref:hypothetical protein n=1 Tax=Cryptosporangium sp. NPDC051539 TaxID=3363962 RepID=UPI003795A313
MTPGDPRPTGPVPTGPVPYGAARNGAAPVNGSRSGANGGAPSGWASPGGTAGDAAWRRPAGAPIAVPPPPATEPAYGGPPRMNRPSAAVGWGPVISSGPVPRALPHQDHDALDRDDAQARAVTVGVGIMTLVVLFLLLLMMVIRASAAAGA